jgi:catechol 2,3-dioxygenase-like lactoylglutathione lyase family enzyme
MTVQRLEHIGIVVDDIAAATAFFVALGLELEGEGSVEVAWWTASTGSRACRRIS